LSIVRFAEGATRRMPADVICGLMLPIFIPHCANLTMPAAGILSLPMHDGLIVPVSALEAAKTAILAAGEAIAGVRLRITVDVVGPCVGD
jgi:hypothetical protein